MSPRLFCRLAATQADMAHVVPDFAAAGSAVPAPSAPDHGEAFAPFTPQAALPAAPPFRRPIIHQGGSFPLQTCEPMGAPMQAAVAQPGLPHVPASEAAASLRASSHEFKAQTLEYACSFRLRRLGSGWIDSLAQS